MEQSLMGSIAGMIRGLRPGRLAGILWLAALLLAAPAAASDNDTVWLLSSHANRDHAQLVDAFTRRLAALDIPRLQVRQIDVDAPAAEFTADTRRDGLIVAVGSDAARLASTRAHGAPVLHVLIPRLLYERLYAPGLPQDVASPHSALYIDQPFERQLQLCRLILPSLRHLGVLYGPASRASSGELDAAAEQLGLLVHSQQLAKDANPVIALNEVLHDSQLLLALPDPDVFNRYSVAGLLLTAYHHGVPVIGFSAAYVHAGALAAVYSTPEQIGREAAARVANARAAGIGWSLPPPGFPTDYSVIVNQQVARSLGMKLPGQDALLQTLQQIERMSQ